MLPLFSSPLPTETLSLSKESAMAFLGAASGQTSHHLPNVSSNLFLSMDCSKADRGGEDAFFVSSYNGGVLAIADGVSGWAEQNVNPALFSQELMSNASGLVMDEEVNYDPQILMRKAHAATSSIGSATVYLFFYDLSDLNRIIAMLEKNGTLKIANVGDCGLRVLRKGQVIFATPPQEHYFDCPYQLSSEIIGQTYLDATVCTIELMEGDTIVMGSDGLFDNVFDHEIVSTTSRFKDAVEAAKALADLARDHSMDVSFDSPYSIEARSRGFDVPLWKKILGRKLTGGKPDDITVIVGQVISSLNDKKTEEAMLKQKDLS
ncbi:putative protein phosphatase 2C 26 [Cocos nucifera]|uniref:Protein phosphatase n=1 Tax=Cocos nucifera TaxID=13894 RepID=A0A8K0N1A2_COCNU|nr:putative protein phosphatase 2C 26 [Cocos nucifera]